jgi:protein-S-isoprenylcysteine O-methyltransferase Ste14
LFWRALVAFLVLPGVVAFAVPLWWLAPRGSSFDLLALLPLSVGVVLLLWTVRDFYVAGRGTLAPWAPPENLVVVGLYRVSRNPMYVAVILVLAGWAIGFRSPALGVYALAIAVGFHLRVVFGEEPWLARTHGEKWSRTERAPRWLGFPGRSRGAAMADNDKSSAQGAASASLGLLSQHPGDTAGHHRTTPRTHATNDDGDTGAHRGDG